MSFFSYASKSKSKSNPSEWVSTQVAKAMVWSDFGLSCFDYPLDRKNRDTVCTLLTDLPFQIVAVWVVSRPVNGYESNKFEHWCVKIQAPPALMSIDFLESKKKGAFGLQQTPASEAELDDFLHYYVRDANGKNKRKEKWRILSSVTPSPLKNTSYLNYMDDYDVNKLKAFMKKNTHKHKAKANDPPLVKHIKINRKICDIADFLGMWTDLQNKRKSSTSSLFKQSKHSNETAADKSYNPITGNCQQFAADLFQYLVGHKKEYIEKVKTVKAGVQSPFDKRKYNVKHSNIQSPINNYNNINNDSDADEKKQQIIEEDAPKKNQKKKPKYVQHNNNHKNMNNPETQLIFDSE